MSYEMPGIDGINIILDMGTPRGSGTGAGIRGVTPRSSHPFLESLRDAGYLTSELGTTFGPELLEYRFTDKAWEFYKMLNEMASLPQLVGGV